MLAAYGAGLTPTFPGQGLEVGAHSLYACRVVVLLPGGRIIRGVSVPRKEDQASTAQKMRKDFAHRAALYSSIFFLSSLPPRTGTNGGTAEISVLRS